MKPHGRTIGYLVTDRSGQAGTLCHGRGGRDDIRFGNPATLFPSRRRAQRAIRDCVKGLRFAPGDLCILRVAPPAG